MVSVGRILAIVYLAHGGLMFSLQTRIIFPGHQTQGQPSAQVRPRPGTELVRLKTAQNVPIVALYGPAIDAMGRPDPQAANRPTLIYFYGNGMCLRTATDEFQQFRRLGLNVLIPEYVGYGMSEGKPSERGCMETADAAYDYLIKTRGVDPGRIAVGGWSLGGAVAIDLASRRKVAALFAFSSFTSSVDMAHRITPLLPASLLLRHRFDSIRKIPKVTCPILIGHGRRDPLVPFAMGQRLATAARAPVSALWIDDAEHNDFYMVAGNRVDQAILRLIAELPKVEDRDGSGRR